MLAVDAQGGGWRRWRGVCGQHGESLRAIWDEGRGPAPAGRETWIPVPRLDAVSLQLGSLPLPTLCPRSVPLCCNPSFAKVPFGGSFPSSVPAPPGRCPTELSAWTGTACPERMHRKPWDLGEGDTVAGHRGCACSRAPAHLQPWFAMFLLHPCVLCRALGHAPTWAPPFMGMAQEH